MKSSNCKKNVKISRMKNFFYENGKYNDDIRMVYEDLLSMGLSSQNVEKCVRLVLEKLAKVKVRRLPKVTFTKNVSRSKMFGANPCCISVIRKSG